MFLKKFEGNETPRTDHSNRLKILPKKTYVYHILKTLNRVRPVKPPSYPQCTYIWYLVYTHLSHSMTGHKKEKKKKDRNMEYKNSKRGSYSFEIWKAIGCILLLFTPRILPFMQSLSSTSIKFSCFLSPSKWTSPWRHRCFPRLGWVRGRSIG
jgi:hypothetical protein